MNRGRDSERRGANVHIRKKGDERQTRNDYTRLKMI